MAAPIYLFCLFFGWWLPAAIYYIAGIWFLLTWNYKRQRAIVWLFSFVALFGYSAYEGVFLKYILDHRAETYRQPVRYADLPDDVATIVLTRSQEDDTLTGHAQSCSVVCAKLLLDGRFKRVVIAVKDRMQFNYHKLNLQAIEPSYPPQSFDVFTMVNEPGCENYKYPDFREVFEAWRLFGRCVHKQTVAHLDGAYLEVTTNEDMPDQPKWRLRFSTHVRVAGSGAVKDIARVEYASVDLISWFPVPGFFPHSAEGGFPAGFWPDLLRVTHHYGPFKNAIALLQDVTGVPLDKPIPLPKFEQQTPENRLRLAQYILLHGPMMERYRFTKQELAALRPLGQDYRDLILEFMDRTKFKGEGYYQMIQYIGWLAAGDPGFAKVIAKMYVERAATAPNGASYARALSHFGPDVLHPYASQLLALYDRKFPKPEDTRNFRADLNFGIGGAGPEVIEPLIGELENPDEPTAASAAASLCRAADVRAAEPLVKKLGTMGRSRYLMSYAYALARLGRGKDALAAVEATRKSGSERACLDEILERYPAGNAPDSICLLDGPFQQPADASWQWSDAQLRCLAPRTASPNGH
jgi:hypothetical protein